MVSSKISLAELILEGTDFGAITVTIYHYSNYHTVAMTLLYSEFPVNLHYAPLFAKFVIVNRSSQNDSLLQSMTALLE